MDRRTFLKAGATAGVAAGLPAAAKPTRRPRKRPNVLYVFSDQHRAASMPGEPFNEAQAPHIDAFRHANLSMDSCISNYPLCGPHRGILMSGRYPAQSGVEDNGMMMRTEEYALTRAFHDAGYRVSYVGKWHLSGPGNDKAFVPEGPRRFGVDDWQVWAQTANHYHTYTFDPKTGEKIYPEGWNPVPMTDEAIALLEKRAAEKSDTPWMMVLSWNPPHPPFDPPADDQAPYSGPLKSRPNVKLLSKAEGGKKQLKDAASLHEAAQGYYGGIQGIDGQFARVLKAVDDLGLAENTIVVYTSDHGEMMGSQGRMSKMVPWEESCRVPFIVRYPGVTPQGVRSDALFSSIDIYPTVCGMAGIPVPKHCVGTDFSPMMRGKTMKTPDHVFLQNGPGNPNLKGEDESAEVDKKPGTKADRRDTRKASMGDDEGKAETYRGIRTATHTYAVTRDGRWLLYNNVADPYQMTNLAQDPQQKALMDGFDVLIKAWLQQTGDRFAYPVTS